MHPRGAHDITQGKLVGRHSTPYADQYQKLRIEILD
jgi:hypothetical protein